MSKKPPILCRKEQGRLVPAHSFAAEQIDALPNGKDLWVRVTQVRSNSQLNLFWAGLGLVVDNFDDEMLRKYPTTRKLYRALLIDLGYAETLYRIDGSVMIIEDSVSFEAMEQDEMNRLMDRAAVRFVEWIGYDPFDAYIKSRQP
jgi:hypothetical protein